jgi:hypothetical protein
MAQCRVAIRGIGTVVPVIHRALSRATSVAALGAKGVITRP